VCSSLCTIVAHNTAQNRPDNFPSCPPDNHHCSDDVYLRERRCYAYLKRPSSSALLGGMVQEKGSRERCSSWTVLHAQSTSALSSGFPLSQGNAEALQVRLENKAVTLVPKNYRNQNVYVKIIVSQR